MASEPKRPVEQKLEALAKARRGDFGDDAKMPNPMRARLHEEVRARHGVSSTGRTEDEKSESRFSWSGMFWPRVAVAAAVATLLIIAPTIWWQRSHPGGTSTVASRESAAVNQMAKAVPEDTLAKGPAGASAAAPTVNLADNSQVKIEPDATPSSEAQSADESRRLGEVHLSPALPSRVMKGFVDKDRAVGQPAPAVAPAAGAVAKTEADKTTGAPTSAARAQVSGGTGVTQQFSQQTTGQAFRNNSQMNRTANVLNSFQVQQEGSEIRVVDSDGSTYTGKIEQLAANAKRAIAKEKPSYDAHVRDVESSAAQSYFRATGFNVSLKKTLVFEGNYVAAPVQQSGARNEAAPAKQKQEPARIVGTAKVKGESPVEVDATAVGPEAR